MFAAEAALLEAHGHEVVRYTVHNDEVASLRNLALARKTLWNGESYQRLRSLFRDARPHVVHVHNTLPLISPAVYYAAKAEGAAVVQTLHNYRYSCVNGLLYRSGHVCEECVGKTFPWPGVLHGCYRGSRPASTVVATMLGYHKLRGTYQTQVDRYVALTEFSKEKFIEMGLPAEKIAVKPNFVNPDPGTGTNREGYSIFVGRLTEEKGVRVLLEAWERVAARVPLKIVGGGPLAQLSDQAHPPGVQFLGPRPRSEVLKLIGRAAFMVFPSLLYETFGMTIAEAFATGTPVLASRLGNPAAIVDDGRTGLHFEPGNAADLAAKVEWLLAHPAELARMRTEARAEYEGNYTADANYRMLMAIYEQALSAK